MTCEDCGTPISDGARRCRRCHREAWDARRYDPGDIAPKPGKLWTGAELLRRCWLDRPPAGTGFGPHRLVVPGGVSVATQMRDG